MSAQPMRRITAALTAVVLLASQVVAPPAAYAGALGSSSASAGSVPPPSVTAIQNFQPDLFTGRATTNIPIVVPPGRKGIQPALALTYSSSARNGWAGVGWNLELGFIERSTKNGPPDYNGEAFAFSLQGSGSELVKRSTDGTFWAKDEAAFLRFERMSGYWRVTDKAGTHYYFGQTTASQLEKSAGNTYRWYLDKVVDVNGNAMLVTYDKSFDSNCYLKQIDYTSHLVNESSEDLAASNKVVFTTQARSDQEVGYRGGFAVLTTRRLLKIEAFAKQTQAGAYAFARRYDFSYQTSGRSSRSLLAQVTQYGNDGTTHLPPLSLTYNAAASTPIAYQPVTTNQYTKPQMTGDVNGDGLADLIYMSIAVLPPRWRVALSTPTGAGAEQEWLGGFGTATSIPVLGDWNGDGRTDIAVFDGGAWQFAVSTGSGFQTTSYSSPSLGSGTPFTGDFNGDGLTDLGVYNAGNWQIALGTGSGFTPAPGMTVTLGPSSGDLIVGDFNGDGLTDLGIMTNGSAIIGLATGTTFIQQPSAWITSFSPGPYLSADINGDGLTDVLYYDKSTGQPRCAFSTGSAFASPVALAAVFTRRGADDFMQLGDFNGDGLMDFTVFSAAATDSERAVSNDMFADLLTTVANGVGGTTTLSYLPSTSVTVTGTTVLAFVLPLVQRVELADGLGHSYATTYHYFNGLYDPATREFRGFGKVEVQDALGTTTTTEFHQTDQRRGHPFRTQVQDAQSNLWTKQELTWDIAQPQAAGSYFIRLIQADSYIYDGDATFKQTRTTSSYDDFGNATVVSEYGEVNGTTDIDPTDNRSTLTTYVPNTTTWIVGLPSEVQVKDAAGGSGNTLADRKFYYDNQAWGSQPTLGRLTKESEWLNTATAPNDWLDTSLAYDAYGNVTTITDAESRTTTNTYDTEFRTYLTQIANAITPAPHTRTFAYDTRTGQVTQTSDPNGQVTNTDYDVLGRVTEVYGPLTTQALPSIAYDYDACLVTAGTGACAAPIRTTVKTRIEAGQSATYDVHAFADGLGRTIQTRSPAQDTTKQIVTGVVEFDARGQVIKQYLPYFSVSQQAYKALQDEPGYTGFAAATYEYDPLGRSTKSTAPGGFITQAAYSDWVATTTDAQQHVTRRTNDAFGRLSQVEEINATETYATRYQYDKRNNLTKVTDHGTTGTNGNETVMAYDSLNRKTSMTDRDMGNWQYTYDKVDNLKTQTDARGVLTAFTYDAVNRLAQKSYSNLPASVAATTNVAYTYDQGTFGKGKLTRVVDGSGQSDFVYDALGRLTSETKTVGTTAYPPILRSYDLLGRLKELTYHDGDKAVYTYNGQGGITTVQLVSGGTTQNILSSVDYDQADRIKALVYGNGVMTTYDYNATTQRLEHLRTAKGATVLQDFLYTFDNVGNVQSIDDQTIRQNDQTFQYDALNRLTQAQGLYGTSNYQYDPLGNLTNKEGITQSYPASGATSTRPHALTSTSDGWAFQYDANGNMVEKRKDAEGIIQTLKYDAENRLVEAANIRKTLTLTLQPGWNSFSLPVQVDDGAVTTLFPTFAQDIDQISRWESSTGSWSHYVGNAAFNQFSTIDYDRAYQVYVKKATALNVTVSGKVKQAPAQTLATGWQYVASQFDGPSTATSTWDGALTFTEVRQVDASGSTSVVTQVDSGKAYWVKVASPGGSWTPPAPSFTTTQYTYDGDGGRVKEISPSGTTTYLGDLEEISPTGTINKYLFAGSQRIAAKAGSSLRFYHSDHLGSTNLVTDINGNTLEYEDFTPYGSLRTHEGSLDTPHKFTGQRLDASTGLYYYHARYYDPQIGRFIQPDTTIQHPEDPQDLNRYSYVRNNPVTLTDPSGYGWFRKLVAAVARIVISAALPGPYGYVLGRGAEAAINAKDNGQSAGRAFVQGSTTAAVQITIQAIALGLEVTTGIPGVFDVLGSAAQTAVTRKINDWSSPPQSVPETGPEQATLQGSLSPFDFIGPGEIAGIGGAMSGLARLGMGGFVRFGAESAGRLTGKALYEYGRALEEKAVQDLTVQGVDIIGQQVRVRVDGLGTRIVDILAREGENLVGYEVKKKGVWYGGLQKLKDEAMEQVGGIIYGRRAPNELLTSPFRRIKIRLKYVE